MTRRKTPRNVPPAGSADRPDAITGAPPAPTDPPAPKHDGANVEEIAARHGFKPLPPDHPIFAEGPAITFVGSAPISHGVLRADGPDDPDRQESALCPFCGSTEDCPHLLLLVDATFREVEGGVLYEAFQLRYDRLVEESEDDPDFDPYVAFDELVDEVYDLATCKWHFYHDVGPIRSSAYNAYYATAQEVAVALKRFPVPVSE